MTPNRDLVVIGASAGGVEALPRLLSRLPPDFPAAVMVAMHVGAESVLPAIIDRHTQLPAAHPQDGEPIVHGRIYIAPPDHHLVVEPGVVRLSRGPKENRHRPAVDPLFRSAAKHFGPRAIGVILTGALDDGTAGLQFIKRCGGVAVVQDPKEAANKGMPESALRYVEVDHCVPIGRMPALLRRLTTERPKMKAERNCAENPLLTIEDQAMSNEEMQAQFGPPSTLICPECNGPIWKIDSGKTTTLRCLVGHAYSPESFLVDEGDAIERALWTAVKTLQERASLMRSLAERAGRMGQTITAESFRRKSEESQEHASVIQGMLRKFEQELPSGNGGGSARTKRHRSRAE